MVCAATEGLGGVGAAGGWNSKAAVGSDNDLWRGGIGGRESEFFTGDGSFHAALVILEFSGDGEFKNWPKAGTERVASVLIFSAVWMSSTPRGSIGSERLR